MDVFASSSSSQVPCGNYDVFISFRGPDVRSGFLSHLTEKLRQKNIDVYVDDRLERGGEISSALVNAIEGSMIALVIFSLDYASSKWCLEELVKIMERKEANLQIVMPVFYHVDPADVRHQKNTYADAFNLHEHEFQVNMDKLQIWRSVLKRSANLSGYHSSKFQNEPKLIDAIVGDVLKNLEANTNPIVPKSQLVGFHQNFVSVESLMKIESQEVRILGVWGMPGIGKTTLARVIFDKFLSKFESCCFLEIGRKESRINDLKHLLEKLLYELIGQDFQKYKNMAMRSLQRKKVLIVLDDVDDPKQLKYLAGHLGLDSRVIATSRDKHILKSGGIQDKCIYEVRELNFEESLELFCIHAFNQSYPNIGYEQLSKMIVAFAKGIPLALEVLGSHFHSRDQAYWESELCKLQKYPHPEIQNILKISYDGLHDMDKEIFLDIAFFFVGGRKDNTTSVLEACGFNAVSGIQNLMDKALIKTNCNDYIEMHDLIREMAEQIVREECMKHPERRSRLNNANEIYDVLESDMGTDDIEGIILDVRQIKNLQLRADVFIRMKNLRILNIFDSSKWWPNTHIDLPSGLDSFPKKLRYLQWVRYPLKSLPVGSRLENLVELRMPRSNVKKLWDGKQELTNLKIINLSGSNQLMELPDLSMARKLEIVDLSSCMSLSHVHPSILSLPTLVQLNVSLCWNLESLESETHLESLCDLYIRNCHSLKNFRLSSKKLTEIHLLQTSCEILHLPIGRCMEVRELILDGHRLRSLPIDELCCLTNLEVFDVCYFEQEIHTMNLHRLFDAWRCNLRELCLEGWSCLSEIPDNIKGLTRLQSLSLSYTSVETLPAWFSHLSSLKRIHMEGCKMLKSILGLPPFIEELNVKDCTSLETVSSDPIPSHPCNYFCFFNCVKLDESSLHFIEELTHSSIISACDDHHYHPITCYPGSKVPEWMQYKPMTEASNAIEFTCNPERSHDILICCVGSYGICCEFSWGDNKKFRCRYPDSNFLSHQLDSDHVFLWYIHGGLHDTGTGNHAKISCEFFRPYWNDEEDVEHRVPVGTCGVHVIYYSNSEPESDFKLELGSETEKDVEE